MLAVDSRFRKRKIGSTLVRKAIEAMIEQEADEVSDWGEMDQTFFCHAQKNLFSLNYYIVFQCEVVIN